MKRKQLVLVESSSTEQTESIAGELASKLKPGDVVALYGKLGSGKTCFVRGLAMALRCTKPVKSPSFNIINEYAGELPLYHLDFYRLEKRAEIEDLGWTDYLDTDGILIIEWAERVKNMLPVERFDVYIEILGPETRRVEIIVDVGTWNR